MLHIHKVAEITDQILAQPGPSGSALAKAGLGENTVKCGWVLKTLQSVDGYHPSKCHGLVSIGLKERSHICT